MTRSGYGWDLLCLTMALLLFFGFRLGAAPLQVPDEARYSEIAREMAVTGDWVTPRINQIQYFEKPPLFPWLVALSIKCFGVDIWTLRLWPMLLGIFGVLSTYLIGRYCFDRHTGLLAALLLSTSVMYFVLSHAVTLDLPVSVFLSASLFCFLAVIAKPEGSAANVLMLGVYGFAALAVLIKGLMGGVFPMAIIVLWRVFSVSSIRIRYHFAKGMLVFLLIALPWHLIAASRHPEFFQFYIIEQHVLRYLTDSAERVQPIWYFLPVLLAGFFPWSLYLPRTLIWSWSVKSQLRKERHLDLYLLIWVLFIFIFFTFSHSKLIPYILPMFPALALLTARALCTVMTQQKWLMWLGVGQTVLLLSFMGWWPGHDDRTIMPLVSSYQQHRQPGDDLVMYQGFYYDLPVYLNQIVNMVAPVRGELAWGVEKMQPANVITEASFWSEWYSSRRLFVATDTRRLQHMGDISRDQILFQNERYTLLVNNPRRGR